MLIDDYHYISRRLRQIVIEEGRIECATCKNVGWHPYCDEEGGVYYTECDWCKNPFKKPVPL